MSGCRAVFMKIDMAVLGIVHFGDDSVVRIEGHGTVVFVCKNGESRSFDGVYFIPRLMTNIVSVNPLDEISYKIDIDTSMMKIRELGGVLLAKVKWEVNRLYLLHLKFTQPTCLAVRRRSDEVVWRWHERIRHVNMAALQKLAREELVHGLPEIGQVGQLFKTCQAGKQRRTSFLVKVEYQAERRIDLVHGDLCGPISPATSRGNKYLLHVDDLSRYMWVAMIHFKDHAAAAIKDIQARAEGESGLKLKALHTDRGGEFNVTEFTDYCVAEDMHHQHTMSYSPQQNGVVERRNGTMVATTRSMLKAKGLPEWF
jgi:ligand-binding SRPBCC domain-containing protein